MSNTKKSSGSARSEQPQTVAERLAKARQQQQSKAAFAEKLTSTPARRK